jgi:protein-S-isoprenylcysteine O-methyltransferase Ste14
MYSLPAMLLGLALLAGVYGTSFLVDRLSRRKMPHFARWIYTLIVYTIIVGSLWGAIIYGRWWNRGDI